MARQRGREKNIESFLASSLVWASLCFRDYETTLKVSIPSKLHAQTYSWTCSHPCWHSWLQVVLVIGEETEMDISSHNTTASSSTSLNLVNHPFTHVTARTRQQRHYGNLRRDALPPPPVLSELSHQNARQKERAQARRPCGMETAGFTQKRNHMERLNHVSLLQ